MSTQTTTARRASIPDDYILNCIDSDGYSVKTETEREKLQFLADTFKSEYGWALERYKSVQKTFVEWIMGLPSSFNIDFYNYRLIKLGIEWGYLAADSSESKQDRFIESFWNRIYMKVHVMCKKHKIDLTPTN